MKGITAMFEPWSCGRVVASAAADEDQNSPQHTERWYRRHLRQCPRCTKDLFHLRTTVDRLRSLPPEPVPLATREVLHVAFHCRRSA
jgi:hypothetical protein